MRNGIRRDGRYGRPETVDELLDRWVETLRVRDVTIADVAGYISWALDEGGLSRVESGEPEPLAPRTIRQGIDALARAIDLVVSEEQGVTRSVARLAKRPGTGRAAGKDLEHWTPEELAACASSADTDPLAGFWRLSMSGLTRSEICGIRWGDIDLDAGTVTITQARVRIDASTSQVGPAKSKQRERTVPFEELRPGTVDLLRHVIANQDERRSMWEGWG